VYVLTACSDSQLMLMNVSLSLSLLEQCTVTHAVMQVCVFLTFLPISQHYLVFVRPIHVQPLNVSPLVGLYRLAVLDSGQS